MPSPFLGFDLLTAGQSQPETTVDTALLLLEAALRRTVIDQDLATPPASPPATAMYIVAAAATAEWTGHETHIAFLLNAVWDFIVPWEGLLVHVDDENVVYKFDGAAWVAFSAGGGSLTVLDVYATTSAEVAAVTELQFDNALVEEIAPGVARVTPFGSGTAAADGHGPLTTLGISSNTITLNHALGADFAVTLTDNVNTVTHTGIETGDANWFTLRVAQDGTGGRTFTPPASWIYPSGVSAYTASAGAGDIDLIQGVTYNNGTTWMISYEKDYV